MRRDTPLATFWSIIGMTVAALAIARWRHMPGDEAMPLFIVFMLLGVPIGELVERLRHRPQPK